MNRPIKELKRIARGNLNMLYKLPMEAFLLVMVISIGVQLPFSALQSQYNTTLQDVVYYLASFLITLLTAVLTVGEIKVHIHMARHQDANIGMVFWGFQNHPDRIIIVAFIISLVDLIAEVPLYFAEKLSDSYLDQIGFNGLNTEVFLKVDASKLGIVAGECILLLLVFFILDLLISLFFQLPYYVAVDHPDMPSLDCIKVGIGLMKGHKGRLFLLMLSFIGMDLLMLLSLGIGALWIVPYKQQTYAVFYLDIIGEVPSEIDETINDPGNYGHPFQQYM